MKKEISPIAFMVIFVVILTVGVVTIKETARNAEALDLEILNSSSSILADKNSNQTLLGPITALTATSNNQSWLEFDGINDVVDGDNNPLGSNIIYNATMSIWINLAGYTGKDIGLMGVMGTTGDNTTLIILIDENPTNGKHKVLVSLGNGTKRSYFGDHYITDTNESLNNWVHYVGRFNDGNISIFENGVLNYTTGTATDYPFVDLTGATFSISDFGHSGSGGLFGGADEARLYNRSLTDAEILEIYNSGRSANSSLPSDDLVLWYSFDAGTGAVAYDKSGNGNNGQ